MPNEPMQTVLPYRVRFSWQTQALGLLFVLGGLLLLFIVEQGPPYPIRGTRFSFIQQHNARAVLWLVGVAAVCLGALPFVFQAITRWRPRNLVISPTAIAAPVNPLRTRMKTVPFAEISDVVRAGAKGDEFLAVHHAGGCLEIYGSALPREVSLDDLQVILNARIGVRAT